MTSPALRRLRREQKDILAMLVVEQNLPIKEAAKRMGIAYELALRLSKRHNIHRPAREDIPMTSSDDNQLMPAIRHALFGRLQEKDGQFRLDGTPASFGDLVTEANRVRVGRGNGQIGKNPAWMVKPS